VYVVLHLHRAKYAETGLDPQRELHFITYGDVLFDLSRERLVAEAQSMKVFTSVHAFNRGELERDEDFLRWMEPLKDVWDMERGGGYWIWKPYIINKTLHKLRNGNVLVYADSGCICNRRGLKRLGEYIRAIDESRYGVLSFQAPQWLESTYTTRQIFEAFNLSTTNEHATSGQYHSTILIFVNNHHARDVVAKWLEFIRAHPSLITDAHNKDGQIKSFSENRHDQSVFSLIRKLRGSVVRRDDTHVMTSEGIEGEWNAGSGEAGLDALKTPFIGARMGNTADSCDGIGRFVCNF